MTDTELRNTKAEPELGAGIVADLIWYLEHITDPHTVTPNIKES